MIAERFRGQILDGSLERLPRQEVLARELGVSLAVVREALRMLEAQGLVTVHRGKTGGATVRVPDDAAISAAITTVAAMARIPGDDVRGTLIALDGLCAQVAAGQLGRAALVRRLEGSLDVQLGSAGDAFGFECARFHAEISRGCGLVMLQSIAGALEASARNLGPAVTRRCERRGLGTQLTIERIVADHTHVVQALADGNGPAASIAAAHEPTPRR